MNSTAKNEGDSASLPPQKKKGFAIDTKALDGLRGVCILHIAISHFVAYPYPHMDLLADISVTAFLVLSGFVLAICYGKRNLTTREAHWAFIKECCTKRFARLFPAWIIGIICGLVIGIRLLEHHHPFPASSFLADQDVSFNSTTNLRLVIFVAILGKQLRNLSFVGMPQKNIIRMRSPMIISWLMIL
jgi:peptidoglycan/LPS O-acetylase OafA/YrhL